MKSYMMNYVFTFPPASPSTSPSAIEAFYSTLQISII